jgi:hypothetical protein
MNDMPHPRYDWLMEYSEALDEHRLLRETEEPSHDELVTQFTITLPWPPEDAAETAPDEELELAAAYANWLHRWCQLVPHPILTPAAVAERLYAKMQSR